MSEFETSNAAAAVEAALVKKPAKVKPILDTTEPEKPLPLPMLLTAVQQRYGQSLPKVVTEIARLGFGNGRVSAEEYFDLRLFDEAGLNGANKHEFLGMRGCKYVGLTANHVEHWYACVSNKIVFYTLMAGFGLPTIKTRAYYHPINNLPALGLLRTPADIVTYFNCEGSTPTFGKPVNGSLSLGTVAVDDFDRPENMLVLSNGRRVAPEALAEEVIKAYPTGFLFQEKLVAHPDMQKLVGNRIGTVRVYTFCQDGKPEIHRACWKVASGGNQADNFWRSGNMLAAFDYETGEIKRAILGTGLNQVEVEVHPDTNAKLPGAKLPLWDEVKKLALWASHTCQSVPLIGWDIAVTDRGPVLVEANNTPDFRLVQMCERRGAYDQRMKDFIAYCVAQKDIGKKRRKSKSDDYRKKNVNKVFGSLNKAA